MPVRPPNVRWDRWRESWRSDVGPLGKSGRRTPVYFREFDHTPAGKREAAKALKAYIEKRDQEEGAVISDQHNPPVGALCSAYLEWCAGLIRSGERAARTGESHVERLRRWIELPDPQGRPYGSRLARSLSDEDAAHILARLRKEKCSTLRIVGVWRSIRAVLRWAAKRVPGREPPRILEVNPLEGVELPTIPKKRHQLVTREEFDRFTEAVQNAPETRWTQQDRETLLLVRVAYETGCRPGELCSATWGDWHPFVWTDESGGGWGVLTVFGKTTRRTGEHRRILVPPELTAEIEAIRGNAKPRQRIWRREDRGKGGAWNTHALGHWVIKWRKVAGLGDHFTLYQFRRTWYTDSRRAGVTADQAGAVGGTSGAVVRDVYFQGRVEDLGEVAAKVRQSRRKE